MASYFSFGRIHTVFFFWFFIASGDFIEIPRLPYKLDTSRTERGFWSVTADCVVYVLKPGLTGIGLC